MEEIRAKEQADLRDAIDGQHNKVSSEEQDELDQLTRDLRRVNIGDATILETNPSPGPAREEAQENFRENMLQTPVP